MAKKIIPINLAIEDELSEAVLRAILRQSGKRFWVGNIFRRSGFGYLKKNIQAFNNASKGTAFLILTDLDREECAPSLIRSWHDGALNHNLLFRVAIREVEAWLIAHRTEFAGALGISVGEIPDNADKIPDPKEFILHAAKKSKSRTVREAIVREQKGKLSIGPGYNSLLSQFALIHWKVSQATPHSDSLLRTVRALKKFQPRFENE